MKYPFSTMTDDMINLFWNISLGYTIIYCVTVAILIYGFFRLLREMHTMQRQISFLHSQLGPVIERGMEAATAPQFRENPMQQQHA